MTHSHENDRTKTLLAFHPSDSSPALLRDGLHHELAVGAAGLDLQMIELPGEHELYLSVVMK